MRAPQARPTILLNWLYHPQSAMRSRPMQRRLSIAQCTSISTGPRTTTHAYDPGELADLIATVPNYRSCYNVGLLNQMALIAPADLFIAQHTGFAFLAPGLGTPWLAISGAR